MSEINDLHITQWVHDIAELAINKNMHMATAESCTGGYIAKMCTDKPGSSAWFEAGLVTYSNHAKECLLGVSSRTLRDFGAVSAATAKEMVAGVLAKTGADLAVAVTGVAGPSGGSAAKPVGTVWIAWQKRGKPTFAKVFHFTGDRQAVRVQTVSEALDGIKRLLTCE